MQQFDVPANVIMQCKPTDNFAELMRFQVSRARETYRKAMSLLPAADKKSQKVGLVMAAIYYALLNEIDRDGAQNVLTYKIAIPSPRKKRIALKPGYSDLSHEYSASSPENCCRRRRLGRFVRRNIVGAPCRCYCV